MGKLKNRVGEIHTTNEGYKSTIIEYFGTFNCTIQFEDGDIQHSINYGALKKGQVKRARNKVGEKFITDEGYEVEIIEWFGCANCTIKFNTERSNIKTKIYYAELKKGKVSNPYHASLFNTGYMGEGKYSSKIDGKTTKVYQTWVSMFVRCYSKTSENKNPTYIGCTVDKRWHNFQNFGKWFDENYVEGYQLDKDILIENNKIYSLDTCCFVPQVINCLFKTSKNKELRGVYKQGNNYRACLKIEGVSNNLGTYSTKEEAIKNIKIVRNNRITELAEEYKNTLTLKVYNRLINK